jgi:hypothetical protein
MDSPDKPITVSRSDLRADLAEMELRLRIYFDDQLKNKADRADVLENTGILRAINRGEFSPAHERAVEEIVVTTLAEKSDKGWTARERIFMVVGILVAVISLALSAYVSLAAAQTPAPQGGVPHVR